MINIERGIAGTRVGSVSTGEGKKTAPAVKVHDEETIALAQVIPFWPEVISVRELQDITGLSCGSIQSRVVSCGDTYLIFKHFTSLSRLKPDLSNCDARRVGK